MTSSDESKTMLSRRDALRLATAVSALGLGLGVSFGNGEAQVREAAPAAGFRMRPELGQVTLKSYRAADAGRPAELLHTLDVTSTFGTDIAGGSVEIKLYRATARQVAEGSAGELMMTTGSKMAADSPK